MKTLIGKEILNYRIEEELGKGGMGSVYLAVNKNINQKVAIKVLNANLADSVVIRKRFRDEAQLLCSLDHPNIVKFLNFVENDDGVFLIMELMDGITLEEFINNKNGLIVENRAYEMFDQILSAFAYAHKKGVVHRDIKPANIILTGDADGNFVPKVLDFGIATIVSESTETEKGWVVGTPAYMSPEQVLGVNVDARSDIYSLGVLLHQMLTGRAPYDTTTLSELDINNKVVKDPLPRMKEFYPYISDKMQKMVDKATVKEPEQRFQSCNEFRKILKNTLKPDPVKRGIQIGAAALVLLFLGTGLFILDYNRTKTYYYKDYAEQWGVPQGIHKLSKSEFRHREESYRFEYKQRKLRALARVNSKGNVVYDSESERFDRPINATFSYRSNGNIDYVLYMDRNDKPLFKKSYDEGKDGKINLAIFRYNDEFGTEKVLPRDMTGYVRIEDEDAEKGQFSRFALSFDEKGFLSAIHYRNENQAVGDGQHIYGKKYERDEKGRVIKEYLLGYDDSVKSTSWGLGIKQFEYDAEDNWVKAIYLSPDGSPSYDAKNGISVLAMEYDQKYGNMTYSWYQNSDGSLTIPGKYSTAGRKYEYNTAGQNTKFFYLGTDKNPMYNRNTGYIGAEYGYDDNGYVSKVTYLDENGQLAVRSDGSTVVTYKNDPKGNDLEQQYFNIDNQPCEISSGYSKVVSEYDDKGNLLKVLYYDTNDSLCLSNAGIAGWYREYDDQNRIIGYANYGTDSEVSEDKNGVVVTYYGYDTRGNTTTVAYFEADDETLKLNNDGIAGWNSEFENGKEIQRTFFDLDEEYTKGNYGYIGWTAAYDDNGNQTEISYYADEDTVLYGYWYTYDDRSNLSERAYFDETYELAQGYLILRWKYDEHDNCIEEAAYDYNDKLAMNNAGYAKVTYRYDDKNQEIERRYYNENGNLFINAQEGFAIVKYEYDNKGNTTKTSYFNASEKPVISNYGYATYIMNYDAMGRNIRQTYFDESGNPTKPTDMVPEQLGGFDKWGNMNYMAAADGSGNKIDYPNQGYSIRRWEYDIRGNEISESYYDKEDKPCLDNENNVHKIIQAYDKQNRQTEISYYDVSNKPCLNKEDNIHKIETMYDGQGNVIEKRFYDANVSLRKDGYAIEKYKYDEQNRRIEYALYDYLDRQVNNNRGWHRIVSSYGETGVQYDTDYAVNNSIIEEWMYDPKTNQWTRTDGWRQYWEASRRNLPIIWNDYSRITAITVSGRTCTITMRINFSKYELSGQDMLTLEGEAKEFAEFARKDSEMPRNTTLVVLGVDNERRDLYRINN